MLLTRIAIHRTLDTAMGNKLLTFAKVGILIAADAAGRKIMGIRADYDALKSDVEQFKTAMNGVLERIAAKVEELGEPDPDLNEIRTAIQAETARASSILAAPVTEPTEPETGETSPGGFETGEEVTGETSEAGGGE